MKVDYRANGNTLASLSASSFYFFVCFAQQIQTNASVWQVALITFFSLKSRRKLPTITNDAGSTLVWVVPWPIWKNDLATTNGSSPSNHKQIFYSDAFSSTPSHGRGAVTYVEGVWQTGCARYPSLNVMRQDCSSVISSRVWWQKTWSPLTQKGSFPSSKIMRLQCIQCIIS